MIMTLPSPGNTAITGPVGGHQLEPNADGSLNVSGSFSTTPPANQRVNAQSGDFVAGSIVDLATQLTLLQGAITGNKMAAKAGAGDVADLSTLPASLTELLGDTDNLANILTQITTLAGIVSSAKAATKAAAGDVVDLATLLTLAGSSGDASTVASFMGRFTKMCDLLSVLASSVATSDGNTAANVPLEASGLYNGSTIDRWKSLITGVGAVGGAYTEQASLSAGSLNADLVPSTDVSAYKEVSLQIFGVWTGTISFQKSNDNTNWVSCFLDNSNNSTGGITSSSGTNGIFTGPVKARYFRARMTAYTSGTANGTVAFYTQPSGENSINTVTALTGSSNNIGNVGQNGTWTVQPGNTANTTPWLVNSNLNQFNGSAVGATNPVLTQDQIRSLILAGKGFTAITKQTSGGAGNFGVALYNPSSNGKTVAIYSIRIYCNQSAAVHEVHLGTTDPAFGNALTPVNNNAGNGTTSGCTASWASATQGIAGTLIAWQAQNTNATQELMSNGDIIVLPSGANNSVAVYVVLGASGGWGAEIGYVEY